MKLFNSLQILNAILTDLLVSGSWLLMSEPNSEFWAIWMFNHVVFSKHAKKKNDASVVRLSEVGLIGANIPGLRILSKPSITLIHTLSKYGAI